MMKKEIMGVKDLEGFRELRGGEIVIAPGMQREAYFDRIAHGGHNLPEDYAVLLSEEKAGWLNQAGRALAKILHIRVNDRIIEHLLFFEPCKVYPAPQQLPVVESREIQPRTTEYDMSLSLIRGYKQRRATG